jgi:DNA-binding MltR family transcriptional regulator
MATLADVQNKISEIDYAIAGLKTKVDSFRTTFDVAITFTDSHHAIIWASILDNALELAILTKMHHLSRDIKDRIFDGYGPLSNFAAKIAIAYALEIIPRELYDSLRIINKVRVRFAHSKHFLSFQDPEISAIIDSLPSLDLAIADRKERYLKKIGEIKAYLEGITKPSQDEGAIESPP